MASSDPAARAPKSAGFLFVLGFGLLAAGLGFAFAPHYSWQVVQVAQQAAGLGLSNGALVVGGLVCFGLGLVARAAGAMPPPQDTRAESEALQSELHILNEQFSTKLAQIRTSVIQVAETVSAVAAQQQALAEGQAPRGGGEDQSRDAMFRLAASLDKLHAHLDERVHAVDLQLRSGFESLLQASNEVRHCLAQGAGASFPGPAARHHEAQPHGHPAHEAAPAERDGGLAFLETMQKLDAISGESEAGATLGDDSLQMPHPEAPFASQGQDLDLLLPEEYRDRY
jgi:hypothetical protein